MKNRIKLPIIAIFLASSAASLNAADYYLYTWQGKWDSNTAFRTNISSDETVAGPVSGENNIYLQASAMSGNSKVYTYVDRTEDTTVNNVTFYTDGSFGTMAYIDSPFASSLPNLQRYSLTINGDVSITRDPNFNISYGMGFRSIENLTILGDVNIGTASAGVYAFFGGRNFDSGSNQTTIGSLDIRGTLKAQNYSQVYIGVSNPNNLGEIRTAKINRIEFDDTSDILFCADVAGNYQQILEIKSLSGVRRFQIVDIASKGFIANTTLKFTNDAYASSNVHIGYNSVAEINASMEGESTGVQELTNSASTLGSLSVISGTLWYAGSVSQTLSIESGSFGAGTSSGCSPINVSEMLWSGGNLLVNVFQAENSTINADSISLYNIDSLSIDFNVFDNLIFDGQEYKFITFNESNITQSDLDKILTKVSGDKYNVDLKLGNGFISATFTAVPEPSAFAAILGFSVLLFAARKRKI